MIGEHAKIPLQHWQVYKKYLSNLLGSVEDIREMDRMMKGLLRIGYSDEELVMKNGKVRSRDDRIRLLEVVRESIKEAMINAFNFTNLQEGPSVKEGFVLKSIWNLEMRNPSHPYMKFRQATNKNRPRIRDFLSSIWINYNPLPEGGHESCFSDLERLKITNWIVRILS